MKGEGRISISPVSKVPDQTETVTKSSRILHDLDFILLLQLVYKMVNNDEGRRHNQENTTFPTQYEVNSLV
jgi:hypothetical protein